MNEPVVIEEEDAERALRIAHRKIAILEHQVDVLRAQLKILQDTIVEALQGKSDARCSGSILQRKEVIEDAEEC